MSLIRNNNLLFKINYNFFQVWKSTNHCKINNFNKQYSIHHQLLFKNSFNQYENKFLYFSALENKKFDLSDLLIKEDLQIEEGFPWTKKLLNYINHDPNFKNSEGMILIKDLCKEIKNLDLDAQISILKLFSKNFHDNNFICNDLNKILDKEISKNIKLLEKLSIEEFNKLFNCSILFFNMFLQKKGNIYQELINKFFECNNLDSSDKKSFLKLIFLINLSRIQIKNESKRLVENKTLTLIENNDITLEELALILLTFFKTQTKISCNLINTILVYISEDIKKIDSPIIISSLIKGIRYTESNPDEKLIKKFIENVCEIDKLNLKVNHQLLVLSKTFKCYNDVVKTRTIANLEENLKTARIKEVDRIFKALLYFDIKLDKKILNDVEEFLTNSKDKYHFPISYLSLVTDLVQFGHISQKLCEDVYINLFKQLKANDKSFYHNFSILNSILRVEAYDKFKHVIFSGQQIEELARSSIQKSYVTKEEIMSSNYKKSNAEALLISSYLAIKSIYGSQAFLQNVVPFSYYPDIILYNSQKDENFKSKFKILANEIDNCSIVLIESRNCYNNMQNTRLNGLTLTKINILKNMGFNVIRVPYNDIYFRRPKELFNYFASNITIKVN